MAEAKTPLVRIGDFFFRHRNHVFPAALIILFLAFKPIHEIFGREDYEEFSDILGLVLVLGGLALRAVVVGFAYIKRGGLNKQVYADTLVTEGFFKLSRNPLYCGNMLIYAGLFITHGNPWVIVLGITSFWFIYTAIIAAEEYFLRSKFGESYREYCRVTPKWLPDFSKFRAATEGMKFNYKKVLAKDYSTFTSAMLALIFLSMDEIITWGSGFAAEKQSIYKLVACLIALLLFSLVIRTLKKTGALTV